MILIFGIRRLRNVEIFHKSFDLGAIKKKKK